MNCQSKKRKREREKNNIRNQRQRKKIGRRNKLSRHFHLPQTSTRHSLHTITLLKACPLEGRRAAQLARLIEFDPLRFIEWHRVETILAKSEISPHSSSLEERREERKSCSWSPRNDWNRDKTCPKSVFIWWIKSWWLDISNVYIYIFVREGWGWTLDLFVGDQFERGDELGTRVAWKIVCVREREREEGWRDAQFDEWLIVPRDYKESRTVCYFFSRVFSSFLTGNLGEREGGNLPENFSSLLSILAYFFNL